MKITIETIPHKDQRYNTVGDWQFDEQRNLTIKVSDFANRWFFFLVAIHELIEAYLCEKAGIYQEDVDAFDAQVDPIMEEPGESPNCPYRIQHAIAESVEMMLSVQLGINWESYVIAISDIIRYYDK